MFIVVALVGVAQLMVGVDILLGAPAITQEIAGLILIAGGVVTIALSVILFHAVRIVDRLTAISGTLQAIEKGSEERAKPVSEIAQVITRMRQPS